MLNQLLEAAVRTGVQTSIRKAMDSSTLNKIRKSGASVVFDGKAVAKKVGGMSWTEGYAVLTRQALYYKARDGAAFAARKFEADIAAIDTDAVERLSFLGGLKKQSFLTVSVGRDQWRFATLKDADFPAFLDTLRAAQAG